MNFDTDDFLNIEGLNIIEESLQPKRIKEVIIGEDIKSKLVRAFVIDDSLPDSFQI